LKHQSRQRTFYMRPESYSHRARAERGGAAYNYGKTLIYKRYQLTTLCCAGPRTFALALLAVVLTSSAFAQPAAAQQANRGSVADRDVAERELSRIAKVISALEREMRIGEADRTQASSAVETHERAINKIAREQRNLAATANRLTAQLKRLRAAHKTLRTRIEDERKDLAKDFRAAYAMGHGDRARLLLQRRDPGGIARLLRYHSYFTRAQRERIVMLQNSLARLDETQRAIANETTRLSSVNERLVKKREARVKERDLRANALVALNAELAENRSTVKRLKKDRQRLSTLITRLRDAISDVPPESEPPRLFKTLRGKLPWPVRGPLARKFGSQRDASALEMHGVLVKAPMGHQVRAIAHGRVVFNDWLRGFGLMVIVDHGDGYMSLYGHNQSLLREPGEWISAGDPLATVGDSGGKDGPGLYFEIRRDGKPQNPARWCSTRAKFDASA
jgi:septal ring factor EnvC (AmiA/AmiB activator)